MGEGGGEGGAGEDAQRVLLRPLFISGSLVALGSHPVLWLLHAFLSQNIVKCCELFFHFFPAGKAVRLKLILSCFLPPIRD